MGAEAIKFEPRASVLTFAVRMPVLRIKPGDIVETRLNSFDGQLIGKATQKAVGDFLGKVKPYLK